MNLVTRTVTLLLAAVVLTMAACSGEQPVTTGAETVSESSAPGETSTTTEVTVPGRLSDERIVALARDAASGHGEPDPEEITWVRAPSRNAAAEVVRGRGSVVAMPEEDVPVVLISIRGQFEQPLPAVPPRSGPGGEPVEQARPPLRAALYLAVDEARNEVMDVDITDDVVDISVLGPVERAG